MTIGHFESARASGPRRAIAVITEVEADALMAGWNKDLRNGDWLRYLILTFLAGTGGSWRNCWRALAACRSLSMSSSSDGAHCSSFQDLRLTNLTHPNSTLLDLQDTESTASFMYYLPSSTYTADSSYHNALRFLSQEQGAAHIFRI